MRGRRSRIVYSRGLGRKLKLFFGGGLLGRDSFGSLDEQNPISQYNPVAVLKCGTNHSGDETNS